MDTLYNNHYRKIEDEGEKNTCKATLLVFFLSLQY